MRITEQPLNSHVFPGQGNIAEVGKSFEHLERQVHGLRTMVIVLAVVLVAVLVAVALVVTTG